MYELKSSAGTKFHGQHNISNVNEKSVLRPWKPEENPEVKFQALISSLFNVLSYIWFWTSVAKFSIHWDPSCVDMGVGTYDEDGELIYNRVTPSIVDANGCVVGKLGSQLRSTWDLWHKSTTVLHDFVVVASFDHAIHKSPWLDVLEIAWWDPNQLAHRINIGEISEAAWLAADREWKFVCLQ